MDDMHDTDDMVSALADGQLRGAAFARAVEAVSSDAAARERWQLYHLVGDVLRSGDAAPARLGEGFIDRLRERLRHEAASVETVEGAPPAPRLLDQPLPMHADPRREAANAGWHWKLVAGFASLAAVAAVTWNMVAPNLRPQAELAQVSPAAASLSAANTPSAGPGVMIRDPRLDELLAAHRQAGGASALQMPSGFLRNATFDVPDR